MHVQMDRYLDALVDGWMDRCKDGWINWMHVIDIWKDKLTDAQMEIC